MHEGVLRDDARRAAKLRERKEALDASREKERLYERLQRVDRECERERAERVERAEKG